MSNEQHTANAYLKTKVMSATPEELRLMLLDGALRFARIGRDGIAEKDYEKSFENIIKAKDIVLELINILRPDVDPDLCGKLSSLYTFMYQRLTDANMEHDAAIVEEVIGLLEYERETWVLLMEKIKTERASGAAPAAARPASAPQAPGAYDGSSAPRLSIEG